MEKKPKFNIGDVCVVTENLLSPQCVGFKVSICNVKASESGRYFYEISLDDGLKGIASEDCLMLIEEVKL